MRGNILVTVLWVVLLLSVSALYAVREGLWFNQVVLSTRERLQLELLIEETLLKVEQLISSLSPSLQPVDPHHCTQLPCVLNPQAANAFFEYTVTQWLNNHTAVVFILSQTHMTARVIFEQLAIHVDLETGLMDQYFRATILLITEDLKTQFRMQATWKKTTLNGNMIQAEPLKRLSWRWH